VHRIARLPTARRTVFAVPAPRPRRQHEDAPRREGRHGRPARGRRLGTWRATRPTVQPRSPSDPHAPRPTELCPRLTCSSLAGRSACRTSLSSRTCGRAAAVPDFRRACDTAARELGKSRATSPAAGPTGHESTLCRVAAGHLSFIAPDGAAAATRPLDGHAHGHGGAAIRGRACCFAAARTALADDVAARFCHHRVKAACWWPTSRARRR